MAVFVIYLSASDFFFFIFFFFSTMATVLDLRRRSSNHRSEMLKLSPRRRPRDFERFMRVAARLSDVGGQVLLSGKIKVEACATPWTSSQK